MPFFSTNTPSTPRPVPQRQGKQSPLQAKLRSALEASNQAGASFQKAGQGTAGVPLADIKDCFHQASDDHRGMDCSPLGKRATKGLKAFSKSKDEIVRHGSAAQKAQAKCVKELQEASRLLHQAGLPSEVSQRLKQAINLGAKSRSSAQTVQREMNSISSHLATLEVSAWSIEMDEDAALGGRNVSEAAKQGESKTDECAKPLQKTSQSANQGAMTQAEMSHLIQDVLARVTHATPQVAPTPQVTNQQASQIKPQTAPIVSHGTTTQTSPVDPLAAFQELEAIMTSTPEQGATTQTSSGFRSLRNDPPFTTSSGFINSETLHSTTTSAAPSVLAFDFESTQTWA